MIRYPWFRSTSLEEDPGDYENVKEVCFAYEHFLFESKTYSGLTFIQCSWCERVLSMDQFLIDYHIY